MSYAAFPYISHPWAEAAAKKAGKAYKNGVVFETGDQAIADDFFAKLGTHSPYGAPIPQSLAVGKNLNNGEYVITRAGSGSDNDQFSPGPGYERIAVTGQQYRTYAPKQGRSPEPVGEGPMQIWRRAAKPVSQAPAAPREPAKLNTAAIESARAKAAAIRGGAGGSYAGGGGFGAGFGGSGGGGGLASEGPYDAIFRAGAAKNQEFGGMLNSFRADAVEQIGEIGAAMQYALDSLDPDVQPPKVMDPWKAYGTLKKDIMG